jgi:hypothetical protein
MTNSCLIRGRESGVMANRMETASSAGARRLIPVRLRDAATPAPRFVTLEASTSPTSSPIFRRASASAPAPARVIA